eukprot:6435866-Alexandrium_andersonii.AAC.1
MLSFLKARGSPKMKQQASSWPPLAARRNPSCMGQRRRARGPSTLASGAGGSGKLRRPGRS